MIRNRGIRKKQVFALFVSLKSNRYIFRVPLLHSSLRLYGKLQALARAEETNDDLKDAWKGMEARLANELVLLLKKTAGP